MNLVERIPARALAIYAHPDDPEVSCSGSLCRWTDAGAEVHAVIATRGEKGTTDGDADPAVLAEQRAGETMAAAAVVGLASVEVLGIPDGEVTNDLALRGRLVQAVRRIRPEVVVTCDPTAVFFGSTYVNHRDHREIGFAAVDACAPAAASPHYFPDAGPAHQVGSILLSGTLEPDGLVDISDTIDRKVAALLCHRSQLGDDADLIGEAIRDRASAAGAGDGVAFAELFRVLELA